MQKNLTSSSPALAGDNGEAWAAQGATALRDGLLRSRYALAEVQFESILTQLAPAIGREPPALHRWRRGRNGLLEMPSLASLKSSVAALRFELLMLQLAYRERKAGFDPNQPRAPKGPGGGQWIDAGGGAGSSPSDSSPSDRAPLRLTIHP